MDRYLMLSRWRNLMEETRMRCDFLATFYELEDAYKESHRHYHVLEHIDACLGEFSEVRHLAHEPSAVELAIWFHGLVYDTHRQDNEEESAQRALRFCNGAGLERYAVTVYRLVLATKPGGVGGRLMDGDTDLLVDIDLSILGQEEHIFDRYERQIRREYEWVPMNTYRRERAKILRKFLDREPSIYRTEHFHQKYEERARENLRRSIAQLDEMK